MDAQRQAILSEPYLKEEAVSRELEAFVRRHARFVYQIAYAVLRNHHDAEDATQETFVRVMRNWRRLPEVRDERAWLARVAWRTALGHRKAAPEIPLDEAAAAVLNLCAAGGDAEQIAGDKQMAALLGEMITLLPRKLRDPLQLSLSAELSSAEIGQVLSIPEGSVRSRLFQARRLLRRKLSSILGGKDA